MYPFWPTDRLGRADQTAKDAEIGTPAKNHLYTENNKVQSNHSLFVWVEAIKVDSKSRQQPANEYKKQTDSGEYA